MRSARCATEPEEPADRARQTISIARPRQVRSPREDHELRTVSYAIATIAIIAGIGSLIGVFSR